MIKGVLFDLDGLLIDSEPLWRRAERIVFSKVGIELGDSDFEHFTGFKINEVVDFWFQHKPWQGKSKIEVENEILDELEFLIETEGKPKPGIMKVLDFFKRKGLPMAIASSSPEAIIRCAIHRLGIESYFSFIQSAEKEHYGKPHPAVYLSAIRQLRLHANECLVLEDSFNGLIAAKAARTKTISVPEGSGFFQTRFDIADLKLATLEDFTEEHWIILNG